MIPVHLMHQKLFAIYKSKHWTMSPRHEFHGYIIKSQCAIYKSHFMIYKCAIYKSHFVIYKSQDYELCDL